MLLYVVMRKWRLVKCPVVGLLVLQYQTEATGEICPHYLHAYILHGYLDNTVYALIFTGLNFCSFCGSIAIRESFIPQKFRPTG